MSSRTRSGRLRIAKFCRRAVPRCLAPRFPFQPGPAASVRAESSAAPDARQQQARAVNPPRVAKLVRIVRTTTLGMTCHRPASRDKRSD